jgi:hypothetical protein
VTSAPWDGSSLSQFSFFSASGASVNDAGSLSVAFHLGAAAQHAGSTLTSTSERTLWGQMGAITLTCDEITHAATATTPAPVSGHCTVIGGTGAYTALHGQGEITGTADLSGLTNAVLQETLYLHTS